MLLVCYKVLNSCLGYFCIVNDDIGGAKFGK